MPKPQRHTKHSPLRPQSKVIDFEDILKVFPPSVVRELLTLPAINKYLFKEWDNSNQIWLSHDDVTNPLIKNNITLLNQYNKRIKKYFFNYHEEDSNIKQLFKNNQQLNRTDNPFGQTDPNQFFRIITNLGELNSEHAWSRSEVIDLLHNPVFSSLYDQTELVDFISNYNKTHNTEGSKNQLRAEYIADVHHFLSEEKQKQKILLDVHINDHTVITIPLKGHKCKTFFEIWQHMQSEEFDKYIKSHEDSNSVRLKVDEYFITVLINNGMAGTIIKDKDILSDPSSYSKPNSTTSKTINRFVTWIDKNYQKIDTDNYNKVLAGWRGIQLFSET